MTIILWEREDFGINPKRDSYSETGHRRLLNEFAILDGHVPFGVIIHFTCRGFGEGVVVSLLTGHFPVVAFEENVILSIDATSYHVPGTAHQAVPIVRLFDC